MAVENAKKFMELVASDEALQRKLAERTEAYQGDLRDERAVFDAVTGPLAKEAGFDISYEDMLNLADNKNNKKGKLGKKLSDDELLMVAGGAGQPMPPEGMTAEELEALKKQLTAEQLKAFYICFLVGIGNDAEGCDKVGITNSGINFVVKE